MMRLGIDIDGVLASFESGFIPLLKQVGCPAEFPIYDATFPPVWDWPEHYGATAAQVTAAWDALKANPFFWVRLAARPKAAEDIALLNTLTQHGHEVYFITTRPGVHAKFQTESWLRTRGMIMPTVLIAESAASKGAIARGLRLDAMIDDRPANLIEMPLTTMSFLLDAPYNRDWTGVVRVTSAVEMVELLVEVQREAA
jgi:5'(3')-deoxyribonucleotidase